jgi:large subunit ribosomal protein L25
MYHVSDIPLPEGVEIPDLAQGEGHDLPVVSIHLMRIEEPEEEVEGDEFAEGAEGEADGEGDDQAAEDSAGDD